MVGGAGVAVAVAHGLALWVALDIALALPRGARAAAPPAQVVLEADVGVGGGVGLRAGAPGSAWFPKPTDRLVQNRGSWSAVWRFS